MTTLTTEDFPYTIGYVLELLGLDERELMTYVQVLGLSPRKDEKTGRAIFTHRDIELLKKASDMKKAGEDLGSIARQLSRQQTPQGTAPSGTSQPGTHQFGTSQAGAPRAGASQSGSYQPERDPSRPETSRPERGGDPSASIQVATASQGLRPSSMGAGGRDNITMMVEAVSQVKGEILKDLGRLLDDKLSGLDEVVVELIRCKSENDSLKRRLDEAIRTTETLEHELSRFKPVQFGFYKKT